MGCRGNGATEFAILCPGRGQSIKNRGIVGGFQRCRRFAPGPVPHARCARSRPARGQQPRRAQRRAHVRWDPWHALFRQCAEGFAIVAQRLQALAKPTSPGR